MPARFVVMRAGSAIFLLLALAVPVVAAMTPGQVFDKVKDTVVVVRTLNSTGGLKGRGSGVLISPGTVATNCHVVEGGAYYQVSQGEHIVHAMLYAEDGDKDICLLAVTGAQGTPASLGKATSLKVGDPVYAVGAPRGLELSLSDGIVAGLRGGSPPLIQTTAAISPGSSGGGLFDAEGQLVGLTTLYVEGGQSLNFAIPAEWIGEVQPGRKTAAGRRSQPEWVKRVVALERMKDWRRMLDWSREWTESEPGNAFAWLSLGAAYDYLARHNDAIEALRQALRLKPEWASAWQNLAAAYASLSRYNEAMDALHHVIRLNPGDADARYSLGVVYAKLGKYNDAIDAFRQAVRFKPDYAAAWNHLGAVYVLFARYNEATDALRNGIRLSPEDALSWNNLGVAYQHLARHNDAIEALRQAVRLDPQYTNAWKNLAVAYFNVGDRPAALGAVRELQRLDPGLADELFNRIVPR